MIIDDTGKSFCSDFGWKLRKHDCETCDESVAFQNFASGSTTSIRFHMSPARRCSTQLLDHLCCHDHQYYCLGPFGPRRIHLWLLTSQTPLQVHLCENRALTESSKPHCFVLGIFSSINFRMVNTASPQARWKAWFAVERFARRFDLILLIHLGGHKVFNTEPQHGMKYLRLWLSLRATRRELEP